MPAKVSDDARRRALFIFVNYLHTYLHLLYNTVASYKDVLKKYFAIIYAPRLQYD